MIIQIFYTEDFAEVFNNLDTDLKIILINYQNNYVQLWLSKYQNFSQHCSSYLSYIYFDGPQQNYFQICNQIFRYFGKIFPYINTRSTEWSLLNVSIFQINIFMSEIPLILKFFWFFNNYILYINEISDSS